MTTFEPEIKSTNAVDGGGLIPPGVRQKISRSRREWEINYVYRLISTDFLLIAIAVACANLLRFKFDEATGGLNSTNRLIFLIASAALVGIWFAFLALLGARNPRFIGSGIGEYRRVFTATMSLFGMIAIFSLICHSDLSRTYLAVSLPIGLTGLILSRWAWRKWFIHKRAKGELQTSVLVLGSVNTMIELARYFERGVSDGHKVVGVCVPGHLDFRNSFITVDGRDIPVLGDENTVIEALEISGADMVAVTATELLGHEGMRRLAWDLESHDVDLVVAPGLIDVSCPRLAMRSVAGLPLLHIERPRYRETEKFRKFVFDKVGAALLILALSPLLIATAALIKLDTRGPVFFRQERVGKDGGLFGMWKFRSMTIDAEVLIESVKLSAGQTAEIFYKCSTDSRITRVGRLIRRTSIDELPQLINVLTGDMSLVGPRPLTIGEGAEIENFVERRILVKPGMTGLWQVSGRSELSAEERVRLDLYYVENWSMADDIVILMRTVMAVFTGEGAY